MIHFSIQLVSSFFIVMEDCGGSVMAECCLNQLKGFLLTKIFDSVNYFLRR